MSENAKHTRARKTPYHEYVPFFQLLIRYVYSNSKAQNYGYSAYSLDCLALFVSISCCRQRWAMRTVGFAVGVKYIGYDDV